MSKPNYIPQSDLASFRNDNTPISCPILGQTTFTPVVDHDHRSGKIRGVISLEGNALLGKIENFFFSRCVHAKECLPEVLRNVAEYLEQHQGPFHPVGLRQRTKRFSRFSVEEQKQELVFVGAVQAQIDECKNTKQRTKLYRTLLIDSSSLVKYNDPDTTKGVTT